MLNFVCVKTSTSTTLAIINLCANTCTIWAQCEAVTTSVLNFTHKYTVQLDIHNKHGIHVLHM